MTREAWVFQRALLASLLFHVLLLAMFMTLPGGGPAVPVKIYTVRILEAPVRPQARELTLSTQAISALKLESPSLNVDRPQTPEPTQADVPAVETFPTVPRAPDALPAPRTPSVTPPAEAPAVPGPRAPTPQANAPTALPSLPAAAAPTPSQPPVRQPAPRAPSAVTLPDDEPARPSAMEQLRSKVRQLSLEVEAEPSTAPQATRQTQPGAERNVLSLRLYANHVREAVKEQYTFPGGFDPSLRTRVRVVLNRDGTVRSTRLLESSGNERFDRLVCLGAFNKARIPPVPQGIEGDGETLTLNFTCSP